MKKEKPNKPGYGRLLDAWIPPDDAGEPVGCVATSFTFSPTLFETECLGRFLQLETTPEEDGPAYLIEREEKLSQLTCAAALVDQHYACGQKGVARSLRWDLLPARLPRGSGILHAKVSLLLWSQHARLLVASANLTDDGYRCNQEVFTALDYFPGSEAPLRVLHEIIPFLQEAAGFAEPAGGVRTNAAVQRWQAFLKRFTSETRDWGQSEPPRSWSKPRILAVLSGPNRPSVFQTLHDRWPDGSPPDCACVISPFFDPPEGANRPAEEIWGVLKQRGAVAVEYHVIAEDIPGQEAVLIHAPKSLQQVPANRSQAEVSFQRLQLEEGRPLHAKCLWLENQNIVMSLIGSSNFTSAGLGLGRAQNLEANLAFVLGRQTSDALKSLERAWPPVQEFPPEVDQCYRPDSAAGEDAPDDALLLPLAFADAVFRHDAESGPCVEFSFADDPPPDWTLAVEEEEATFVSEAAWVTAGRPPVWRVTWERSRAPSGFRVRWRNSGGSAWWPVNVVDAAALPPPDDLKDLPLDVLIEILTSAKPLHLALAGWLKRKRRSRGQEQATLLDPHQRVDTSSFLLQRTRRVSAALSALRQRLERPVFSEPSLWWRLRGPVGVLAFVQAIEADLARGQRPELERTFLLTEVCLELSRVQPQAVGGSLKKGSVQQALRNVIVEIRGRISEDGLAEQTALGDYTQFVFQEIGV